MGRTPSKSRRLAQKLLPPKAWKGHDGCSGVPDYHFRPACKTHDWRYREAHYPPPWTDGAARKHADKWLRRDMKLANADVRPEPCWERAKFELQYRWMPWVWYIGVRMLGKGAWTPLSEREAQ